MKKRLLAYLFLVLGLGLMFNVNADANNSTLADILEFQPTYKKSGNIKHGGKKYNFWTKTDKKSLDGKERKVVAISVSEKNSGKTIEQYYINYYQTGVVEYSKLLDPKNASGDVWTIDKNPEDLLWYSERIAYWKKNKNGKDVSIGKWKTRDTKEWRKRVNKWTAGAGIPRSKFQPFAEKRKVTKMKPLKGYPRADIYGAPKGRALDENEVQLRDLSSMITSLR